MAALDARGTTAAAAESGLARETILKLAKRLHPDEVLTLDQAIIELESAVSIAVDLIQAGARGTNHDAFVDAVLRRVAEKVKADDLDGAARALDDELAAMAEREERLKRDRITLLERDPGRHPATRSRSGREPDCTDRCRRAPVRPGRGAEVARGEMGSLLRGRRAARYQPVA